MANQLGDTLFVIALLLLCMWVCQRKIKEPPRHFGSGLICDVICSGDALRMKLIHIIVVAVWRCSGRNTKAGLQITGGFGWADLGMNVCILG